MSVNNADAPLDHFQAQVRRGINEFIHWEVSGAAVLLAATIVAMIVANSPVAENYIALWQTKAGFKVGSFEFFETLQHWINDFLMAFFFFVVGLEIKREVVVGELSSMRKAILPIAGAIGHALSSPAVADAQAETTRRFTIIAPRFKYQPSLVSL